MRFGAPKLYHIILARVNTFGCDFRNFVCEFRNYLCEFLATMGYNHGMTTKHTTTKRIAIYDMDGTIVCSLHRYRTIDDKIDLAYWRDNEYRAMDDSLLPLSAQYFADMADENCYVVIATARILRDADNRFIAEYLGKPNAIISRKDGDTRSGGLLKILGLKKLFNLRQFAGIRDIIFYEDNTSYLKAVCDYFNIRGVYIPSKQGH